MGTVDASVTRTLGAPAVAETGGELAAGIATAMPGAARGRRDRMSFAYAGLILFTFAYYARPEDWIPGTAPIPFAKITGFLALAGFGLSLAQKPQTILRLPRDMVYLLLLFAQLCLTVPFSPVWRGGAFDWVFFRFSKIVVISPAIALAVTTSARLRRLIFVQASAVATVVALAVRKNQLTTGVYNRLGGGLWAIYDNPNDFAITIALAFPFCFMFLLRTRSMLKKSAWGLGMLVMVYAALSSYSRAGLLAFLVAAGISVWEFGVKGRRRYLVVLGAVALLGTLLLGGPAQYGERVASIFNPDLDPTGSAGARRELLKRSIGVTLEHPLFGVGAGNFQVVSGNWHGAHNSYTELSAEAGIPALILFLMMLWRSFANVRDASRLARGQPELLLLAGALRATLLGFVVGAFFADFAYQFFPYFLVGYASALRQIAGAENRNSKLENEKSKLEIRQLPLVRSFV